MVFDIKMEKFKCKAQFLVGSHMNNAPAFNMYVSVVSRETARVALMGAAFNDLDIKWADILNVYIQVPVIEKM